MRTREQERERGSRRKKKGVGERFRNSKRGERKRNIKIKKYGAEERRGEQGEEGATHG